MGEGGVQPFEQRSVSFYDGELVAMRAPDGTIYVPLRPICDRLGIAWNAQYERIRRDEILSALTISVRVTRTEIDPASRQPHSSEMLALPLSHINGWLFGISAGRVNPAVKPRLLQYQRDCYRVLYEAFQQNAVTAAPVDRALDDYLATSDEPEARAYRMAMAIANLARQQLLLRADVGAHAQQLDDHERRIQLLEARGGNEARYIDNEQAGRLSQAVKALAIELGRRSGRNEFGGVYGELYRRFGIAAYRELPATRFDEAMAFLRAWYQSITDGADQPF